MTQSKANKASLADYQTHPERYLQRVHPERLNWGEHMDIAGLTKAGLSANRVPVIGDWDFAGACVKVNGTKESVGNLEVV